MQLSWIKGMTHVFEVFIMKNADLTQKIDLF